MTLRYKIVNPGKLVVTGAAGLVTLDDFKAYQQAVAADPHFRPDLSELFVISALATLNLKSNAMRHLAEMCVFSPAARRAFIAPRDHLFGIVRMYQAWLGEDGEGMKIFRTLEEATRWLGPAAR